MPDQQLTCADCGTTFDFPETEQEFFKKKGFAPPKRCKPCRQAKKQRNEEREAGGQPRRDRH